jgi:molybdenum cofactor biosynthesis protein B
MGAEEHKKLAKQPVACAVITVSDTRTEANDTSGKAMRALLEQAGHSVGFYRIVKDEPEQIRQLLAELSEKGQVQTVLLNGGTGISRRDTTYEAVAGLLEKRLDGFGELFRMLSYQEIGPAAMLSRAVAGTYRDLLVFSTPGSTAAVRLAMEKLIVPELPHLVWEVWRQKGGMKR